MTSVEDILLSVVVPTHNVRAWIDETLFSLQRQDVASMEIIVVDDHSDDGTAEIVEAAAAGDARLRLIRATARGGGSARNVGTDAARGRYLVFCDGDDIVPDGAYRALVDSLESSGSEIAFGDYWKFSSARTWHPTASMSGFSRVGTRRRFVDEPTLLYSRPCWNKAFSREFWNREELRFPDAVRSNDIVPMVRAYLAAKTIDVIPNVVYLYRERPGGSSMSSRAGSSDSIMSYLTQELECARLVAATGEESLSRVYSSLIYDRDGFAHLSKYFAGRERLDPTDESVVACLRDLAALAGEIPVIEPLKRITFLLAANGDFVGARGAALLALDVKRSPSEAATLWTDLVEGLRRAGIPEELVRPSLRDDVRHVLASRDDADESWMDVWEGLRQAVLAIDESLVSASVPELVARPSADIAEVVGRRERETARISQMRGGHQLVVRGRSRERADRSRPVLLVAGRSGQPHLVRPRRFRWIDGGSGARWEAAFAARHIPLFGHAHVAMVDPDGSAVAIDSDSAARVPRRWDSVTVDHWGTTSWATRRRHWALRGVRSVVEPRAGRLVRRLRAHLGKQR